MKYNNDKKWTVADVLTNFGKTQAQIQQEKQLKQQLKESLMQNQAQALGQFVPGMNQQMQPLQQDMSLEQSYQQAKHGGMHIDPSKKGTFKAQATRMGMGIQEAAAHILANRDEFTSGMVRKANFARNFAKEEGGTIDEYGNGGYTVRRSNDRKGKTHVVTGPDGTKKYFGDPNMGERSKSKYGKDAFYARHADSLRKNPYFRAYAKSTWEEGGETNEPCPPEMHWDPVLKTCVPDTYDEAPTIQQIYNDPELLMRLKQLEHKRKVDEYMNWRYNQIFDNDTNRERFNLPNGFYPHDEKGKEIPGGYPDTEFGKWLREFNKKNPAPNKIKDYQLPDNFEQNDGHDPTLPRYPQDLKFDFENMDEYQRKDYNEYIKFFQPDGTTPLTKPQLQKQMGEDYDNWCPYQKTIILSDGSTKKICVSYEESLAEYGGQTYAKGGEMYEPCPNGMRWDPIYGCIKISEQNIKEYSPEQIDNYFKSLQKSSNPFRSIEENINPDYWNQPKSKFFRKLLDDNKVPYIETSPNKYTIPKDELTPEQDNQLFWLNKDYTEKKLEILRKMGVPPNEWMNYIQNMELDEDTNPFPSNMENEKFKELYQEMDYEYEDNIKDCPCRKKKVVNNKLKEVCIPCEQAEYGGEMTKYAPGGSTDWPPGRGKNKTYLTYSPFYGNSLTGQSSNMGYADNPFSDEKSDFFKVNTIRMPQSYIGISGGADPYGKFNHNDGIMKKLGYDAYVGLPYNYDPNNTNYYSNTPSVGGRIRYNNTIDNRMLGIPWNKVFVEASGDYSQSDGLNANFSVGPRFDGKKGNSRGYFEPHIGVSGSWGPHNIKPGAYSANALAQYQLLMQTNDIPDLEGDAVNMSDPAIQVLLSDIYNEGIENPLAKGKKQQGAMADIDLGFKTGFEWQPKWLTKRLPGSKIFGDLRYTAQPIRGMWVSGMSENSQSNFAGMMGNNIIQSDDQSQSNKLAFSHQFTGGLGLKVPIGTVKDKINNIDFIRTRIPKDCMCPDGTKVDRLEDGSCPCDDYQIEECPPCPDGSIPQRLKDGTCPCDKDFTYPDPDEWARHPRWLRDGGEMIKRADGSYSQRGLWDNIRANKGSGKEPTREMLQQERKIRKKAMGGTIGPNDCKEGFVWNDIYQMCVPIRN